MQDLNYISLDCTRASSINGIMEFLCPMVGIPPIM